MLKSGGRFFYKSKVNFSKVCQTPAQLVALLKARGLSIKDDAKASSYLTSIGYFRLSAYFYPLLEAPKTNHKYKVGSSFKQVMDMYRFDRKLRLFVFNEIEKIEVAIRSQIASLGSLTLNNVFWLTDQANFTNIKQFQITKEAID